MDREPISSQPEVNVIKSETEGLAQRERERHLDDANYLIERVDYETVGIVHRDQMLVALSRVGIKTINEDLDNNIKRDDVGLKEVVEPSFPNITDIETKIRLLEELGGRFGYNQSQQAESLKNIITQIRFSRDEETTRKLVARAKNIFSTNVTSLLNKHNEIAGQQQDLGDVCNKNGRQLQRNLEDNFNGQTRKKIDQGPVGFYVRRSVKYGEEEVSLVEETLNAHSRYENTLRTFDRDFNEVMDSFVVNNNNDKTNPFS